MRKCMGLRYSCKLCAWNFLCCFFHVLLYCVSYYFERLPGSPGRSGSIPLSLSELKVSKSAWSELLEFSWTWVPSSLILSSGFGWVFLFEEAHSLSSPCCGAPTPPLLLTVRWGEGQTQMRKKASCQHSRSPIFFFFFFARCAPRHFSQHLPVLLPTFMKDSPTLESHCDAAFWE